MEVEARKMFDRAIFGTQKMHPEYFMPDGLEEGVTIYLESLGSFNKEKINNCDDYFATYFSKQYYVYNVPLREPINDYKQNTGNDIVLSYLEALFNTCYDAIKSNNVSARDKVALYNYFFTYINIISPNTFDSNIINSTDLPDDRKVMLYEAFIKNNDIGMYKNCSLNSIKERIYSNPASTMELIKFISPVIKYHTYNINEARAFDYDSINVKEVSPSAIGVLTNTDSYGLSNSYSGLLLDGKIQTVSDRGYIYNPERPQQDAVLSVAKSEDCFLNVVADGAGGATAAEKASSYIIERLKSWFNSKSEVELKNKELPELAAEINFEFQDIDNSLKNLYPDCYATVVIALTIGDYTLVANVGDSTAYMYNESSDRLEEISTLDSDSNGLSYEGARENEHNNQITAALGMGFDEVHFNVVENNGKRLILSSDGVTDLVSERNFKDFFRNKIDSQTIVNKAVWDPDYVPGVNYKNADNVSAIVIDLPESNKLRRRI